MSPLRTSSLLLAALVCAAPLVSAAQGTRLWTLSRYEEFEKGRPQGVEITSDGRLTRGPGVSEVTTTPSGFVWAVAEGQGGEVYAATGTPAKVLRIGRDGKSTEIFETKAVAVQALRIGPDGALYAATMPDGMVYRLKAGATTAENESSAEVVFDLGKAEDARDAAEEKGKDSAKESRSHYIWDLTFDRAGRLYIATGGPAAIYRIDPSHTAKHSAAQGLQPFFHCDEQHIRSVAWDKDGNLIAGTDGSGLVYRISPEGKGYVLFSAPRREITALAIGADGTIYAADVGDKSHNPLPQLPVQAGIGITISFVQPGSMQAANASVALPEGTEIYALTPNQAPRKVWSGKDEIVYHLASAGDDLIAVTGNRGRVFRVHRDGSFSDIAHLDAQLAVSLSQAADGWLIGTGNTGKVYRLGQSGTSGSSGTAADHTYASDVLDASALTRWGRVDVDPESHGYQIWTRSGNVEQPARSEKDWGWSDWQPLNAGKVASPSGRYLQWKAELEPGGGVAAVAVNYLPVNSAPVLDDLVVVPGARVVPQGQVAAQPPTVPIAFPSQQANAGTVVFDGTGGSAGSPVQAQKDRTAVTVRWAAHDDDGDELAFDLYLMGDGEHIWRPLKKNLNDRIYSFDGADFPDGGYRIRIVAKDSPSHTPGDALTSARISDRFELDTTPPIISGLKAGAPERAPNCDRGSCPATIAVSFEVRDAMSTIGHAEYSIDAGTWHYLEPVGDLSDSKEERYEFQVPVPVAAEVANPDAGSDPAETEHLITVRAYDRHDNMATAKVITAAPRVGKGGSADKSGSH